MPLSCLWHVLASSSTCRWCLLPENQNVSSSTSRSCGLWHCPHRGAGVVGHQQETGSVTEKRKRQRMPRTICPGAVEGGENDWKRLSERVKVVSE
ncbi:hypothetical protein K466DRAFT_582221 [Polyporus arcularius HHB13444]|uniref:Secreted protein n=1 Tax=Polyporus arcularius HHB13444 TaxID=1314778 RepID=A0A5C3PR53_9APHY|nr:hypothetical protein K466DRAFT_582221 [Polyporus arcularius HHB13444]